MTDYLLTLSTLVLVTAGFWTRRRPVQHLLFLGTLVNFAVLVLVVMPPNDVRLTLGFTSLAILVVAGGAWLPGIIGIFRSESTDGVG